jgi:hypothetical protein
MHNNVEGCGCVPAVKYYPPGQPWGLRRDALGYSHHTLYCLKSIAASFRLSPFPLRNQSTPGFTRRQLSFVLRQTTILNSYFGTFIRPPLAADTSVAARVPACWYVCLNSRFRTRSCIRGVFLEAGLDAGGTDGCNSEAHVARSNVGIHATSENTTGLRPAAGG